MSIDPLQPRHSAAKPGTHSQAPDFHFFTQNLTETIDSITTALRDGFVPNRPSRQGSFSSSNSSDNASRTSFQASDASSATSLSPSSDCSLDSYDEQSSNTIRCHADEKFLAAAEGVYYKNTVAEGVVSGFPDEKIQQPRSVISHLGLIKLGEPVADRDNGRNSFWQPPTFNCDPAKHKVIRTTTSLQTNPRRSSTSHQWRKPSLVRQSDRREEFVESLIDCSTTLVACIWPNSSLPRTAMSLSGTADSVLPLRTFIRETLRRSHSSYSTLQVTLYYIILLRLEGNPLPSSIDPATTRAVQCGRRMFLAALMLASKYLQDRNFSARAWSKISGLRAQEITHNELVFLKAIDWKLHMNQELFGSWTNIVDQCINIIRHNPSGSNPWSEVLNSMLQGTPFDVVGAAMFLHHVPGIPTFQLARPIFRSQLEASGMSVELSTMNNKICRLDVQTDAPSCGALSSQQPLDFESIYDAMHPNSFALPHGLKPRLNGCFPGTASIKDQSGLPDQAQNHEKCSIANTLTSKAQNEIGSSSAAQRNQHGIGRTSGIVPPTPVLGRNLSTPQIQPLSSSACAPAVGSKTSDYCHRLVTGQISLPGAGTPGAQSTMPSCSCKAFAEAMVNCASGLLTACEYSTSPSTDDIALSNVTLSATDLTTMTEDSANINYGSFPFRPLVYDVTRSPGNAEAAALSKVVCRAKKRAEAHASKDAAKLKRFHRKRARSLAPNKTDSGHPANKRVCSSENAPMEDNARKVRSSEVNTNHIVLSLKVDELTALNKWEIKKVVSGWDHGRKQARRARALSGRENE